MFWPGVEIAVSEQATTALLSHKCFACWLSSDLIVRIRFDVTQRRVAAGSRQHGPCRGKSSRRLIRLRWLDGSYAQNHKGHTMQCSWPRSAPIRLGKSKASDNALPTTKGLKTICIWTLCRPGARVRCKKRAPPSLIRAVGAHSSPKVLVRKCAKRPTVRIGSQVSR